MKRSVSVSVDLVMVKWLILTVQEGHQETEIGVVFSMKRSGYIKARKLGHLDIQLGVKFVSQSLAKLASGAPSGEFV